MDKQTALSYKKAHRLFRYDERSGRLFWKVDSGRMKVGDEVGCLENRDGRRRRVCNIGHRMYFVHRIIWLMAYGKWPRRLIDHEDHDGCNNRLLNLREVNTRMNAVNATRRVDNTSGVTGVCWFAARSKWRVRVSAADRSIVHVGDFKSKRRAVSAVIAARRDLGYHPNHGQEKAVA